MVLHNYEELLTRVRGLASQKVCAVAAADEHAIQAALDAERHRLAKPIFVGDATGIRRVLQAEGVDPDAYTIVEAADEAEAAAKAVALARDGAADIIMKGHVNTPTLLKAVVNKEHGLGTGRLMTHLAVFDLPMYHKVIFISDGGMVTRPDLEQKKQILDNAIFVLHALGYDNPKVACLASAETVSPKIQETVDGAALKEMNRLGEITGCVIEGPISLDLAMSPEAVAMKGYDSPVAGDADFLLAPDVAVGNILGKSMNLFGGAPMIGLIVGAKVPIILTSRGSTAEEKYLSVAMSALISEGNT